MLGNNFLELTQESLWTFHRKCATELYDWHQSKLIDVDSMQYSQLYEPFFTRGIEIGMAAAFDGGSFSKEEYEPSLFDQLKEDEVYKRLWGEATIQKAYKVYSKFAAKLPLESTDSSFVTVVPEEYKPVLEAMMPKLDDVRFVGELAGYFALYLLDKSKVAELRKYGERPADFRDKLIGRQEKKNTRRPGVLTELIRLVERGYGLRSPWNNKILMIYLWQLLKEAEDLRMVPPEFSSVYSDSRKRLILRIGTRFQSTFKHEGTKVHLMLQNIIMCLDRVDNTDRNRVRNDIDRTMKLWYEHTEVVLEQVINPHFITL